MTISSAAVMGWEIPLRCNLGIPLQNWHALLGRHQLGATWPTVPLASHLKKFHPWRLLLVCQFRTAADFTVNTDNRRHRPVDLVTQWPESAVCWVSQWASSAPQCQRQPDYQTAETDRPCWQTKWDHPPQWAHLETIITALHCHALGPCTENSHTLAQLNHSFHICNVKSCRCQCVNSYCMNSRQKEQNYFCSTLLFRWRNHNVLI